MKKTIFLLAAMCLPFFMLTSCSKDDDDNGTGKNTHYLKCPDDHHPHAIDLGLPSGTKWCCCNVDAAIPEGPGGHYAWGETSEKSVYNWETYAYYNSDTGYQNIGSDIAGTEYDVAHVRMGGSWCMPNVEQVKELGQNCTYTFTQQNGVNGFLIIGKNGGQIFLPAAGYRYDDILYLAGSEADYWSSSIVQDNSFEPLGIYAGAIRLIRGLEYWGSQFNREWGQSVRAVCP